MNVIEQNRPNPSAPPGVAHATWAGQADGLTRVSVCRQTLAPGAATPLHSHDCDEVVLCQSGWGELHIDGQVQRFGGGSPIMLPRCGVHQNFNTGSMPIELVTLFGGTPVGTFLPDGEALEVPWRT